MVDPIARRFKYVHSGDHRNRISGHFHLGLCRLRAASTRARNHGWIFSQFIYRKTLDALALDGPEGELNQDGLWIREHERELVSRYGSQWIAVVRKEVLATAPTGDEAWNAAIARQPSRKPFVRRLSAVNDDFEKREGSTG